MENIQYDGNPRDYEPLIRDGYDFNIESVVRRGWELFKVSPVHFVLYFLVVLVIGGIVGAIFGEIRFLGPLITSMIGYLLSAGLFIVAERIAMGEKVEFSHFFDGFQHFRQLAAGAVVVSILVNIGTYLLIIPGLYLAVAYSFTVPLIVLERLDFWNAMETSRKVITKRWFHLFGLFLVILLINLLGAIALGVGLLVSMPLSAVILYAAYESVMGKAAIQESFDEKIDAIGEEE